MTDRHTAALAAFQRGHPEHSRSIEMALYYITVVCCKRFTLRDSFGQYRAKFTGWCVRNHLPYGMAGQCFGRLLSHRYRSSRISVPDDFTSPVILTPLGLGNVRWTLDYYRKHPCTEYPPDGSLFGRSVEGRTSICERCVHNRECELCPKFTWKCPIDRFESKIKKNDADANTVLCRSRGFRSLSYGSLYGVQPGEGDRTPRKTLGCD